MCGYGGTTRWPQAHSGRTPSSGDLYCRRLSRKKSILNHANVRPSLRVSSDATSTNLRFNIDNHNLNSNPTTFDAPFFYSSPNPPLSLPTSRPFYICRIPRCGRPNPSFSTHHSFFHHDLALNLFFTASSPGVSTAPPLPPAQPCPAGAS